MTKDNIFISYNSKDRELVELFTEELKNIDLHVFLDVWDLTPGEPWQEEIENNLTNSKYIIIFIGKNGLGRWQNEEMRLALDLRVKYGLTVIPVLFPEAIIEKVPLFLSQLTWVDFREGLDNSMQYNRLIFSLGVDKVKKLESNIFFKNRTLIKKTLFFEKNDMEIFHIENILIHTILILYFLLWSLYNYLNESNLSDGNIFFEIIILFLPISISLVFVIKTLTKKRHEIFKKIDDVFVFSGFSPIDKNIAHIVKYINCDTCDAITPSISTNDLIAIIIRFVNFILATVPIISISSLFFIVDDIEPKYKFYISMSFSLYFLGSIWHANIMALTIKFLIFTGIMTLFGAFYILAIILLGLHEPMDVNEIFLIIVIFFIMMEVIDFLTRKQYFQCSICNCITKEK